MYHVYIMASKKDGILYVGATHDIKKRSYEHRKSVVKGFTRKYFIWRLVYYEIADTMDSAFYREKQLKKWNRPWKIRLIKTLNPDWKDLYNSL